MKKSIFRNSIPKKISTRALMLAFVFGVVCVNSVFASLTITPVTWNVVGLDSNNVAVGPNVFPLGARVCNISGGAVNNVVTKFVWNSSNSLIAIDPTATDTQTMTSLAANSCADFYFDIVVTRSTAAYNSARRYQITATGDGVSLVSTPTPREVFVEKLVSQNRNSVSSITGPSTVYVGQTYNYTVNASTATGGYEQLEAFLSLSNVVFRVLSISTTYTAPTGGTNNKIYADACGWENNPTSINYRKCVGPVNYSGGKAGGTVRTTYTVRVISSGSTTATTLIYDFSGSSYHYNSDYGAQILSITALPAGAIAPQINLNKSVSPEGTQLPGTELTYTISFTNSGFSAANSFRITDPNPANTALKLNTNTDYKIGSTTISLGTTSLAATVSFSNDNGINYNYTPVSGGGGAPAGFDRNVTHIRWTFSGSLSQIAPNNMGSVSFIVKIH